VRLHIKNSTFTNNSPATEGLWGGALLVAGGSAVVESSSFVGNTAKYGGAIAVRNSASLKLVASVAKGNKGEPNWWLRRAWHA
jgi:predicted outer membrane repeat protein